MTAELQTPTEPKHLIPTFCEYINKYILQTAVHGKGAVLGEHHFVALYLLSRLAGFSFLGVPHTGK